MGDFPSQRYRQQIGNKTFIPLPTVSDLSVSSFEHALTMLGGDAQELACNEYGSSPRFFEWLRETHPCVKVTFIPEGEMGHIASWWLANRTALVYSKW